MADLFAHDLSCLSEEAQWLLKRRPGVFIDGQWQETEQTFPSIDPASAQQIAEIAAGTGRGRAKPSDQDHIDGALANSILSVSRPSDAFFSEGNVRRIAGRLRPQQPRLAAYGLHFLL
jgi:hypothetical protein